MLQMYSIDGLQPYMQFGCICLCALYTAIEQHMLLLTATDHCCILKVTAVMNSKFVTVALSQVCLVAYAVQLIVPDRANTHSKLKKMMKVLQ